MSRCLEYVHQNTNGLNHGAVWKIQSFLLSEICTVILQQDYYGEGNSRKFYQNTVGKKFRIVNVYSLTVDDIKLTGKKQNIDPMLKNAHERR